MLAPLRSWTCVLEPRPLEAMAILRQDSLEVRTHTHGEKRRGKYLGWMR
jgi:hypothetical protein